MFLETIYMCLTVLIVITATSIIISSCAGVKLGMDSHFGTGFPIVLETGCIVQALGVNK